MIAVCSWISVPSVIPFSMQTFAIFLAVNLLGAKKASVAIALYIITGSIGLPVFSGFRGGLSALISPTGGFIFGFFMIPLSVKIISCIFKNKRSAIIPGEIAGLFFCYILGAAWFTVSSGNLSITAFLSSVAISVIPYIIPDILKLYAAYLLFHRLEKRI